MTSSEKFSKRQEGKSIVLSIKPKYAELILSGSKTVEFRRAWAAQEVSKIAVYVSAPVQKFMGVVQVSDVVRAKPVELWKYCTKLGGGLSKKELASYFQGKDVGVAVLLSDVKDFAQGIDPRKVIRNFSPPQSFRYMTAAEMRKLEKLASDIGGKL